MEFCILLNKDVFVKICETILLNIFSTSRESPLFFFLPTVDMLSTLASLFTLQGCKEIPAPSRWGEEKSAVNSNTFPFLALIDSGSSSAYKTKCPCVPVNTQHLF